jgi:hypothetical protein
MINREFLLVLLLVASVGCSTRNPTPGATLLSGLSQYQAEMQRLGNAPERWPERQSVGGTLKTLITATVGGSREFYRLVDLDIRKREFVITMRDGSVRADRLQEMKEELLKIDEEIAALKPVVRAQIANMPFQGESQPGVENAATLGLLSLAVDRFPSSGGRGLEPPSTKVDQYVITDLGSFAAVRSPEGQTYRCAMYGIAEEGAGLRCEAAR